VVGRWSYALYLWHWVVWVLVQQTPLADSPAGVLVALTLTALLSVASHYLLELPLLRRDWRWSTIALTVTIVSALLAASSLLTLASVPLPDSGTGDVLVSTH